MMLEKFYLGPQLNTEFYRSYNEDRTLILFNDIHRQIALNQK